MSLNDSYWEKYLDSVKNRIPDTVNSNEVGEELKEELLELYNILDDKEESLEGRKQKALEVEHFLWMCNSMDNDDVKKR